MEAHKIEWIEICFIRGFSWTNKFRSQAKCFILWSTLRIPLNVYSIEVFKCTNPPQRLENSRIKQKLNWIFEYTVFIEMKIWNKKYFNRLVLEFLAKSTRFLTMLCHDWLEFNIFASPFWASFLQIFAFSFSWCWFWSWSTMFFQTCSKFIDFSLSYDKKMVVRCPKVFDIGKNGRPNWVNESR